MSLLLLTLLSAPVTIEIENSDPEAKQTRDRLAALMAKHDLSKWTFTRRVVIDGSRNVIPHSHPVLTLHDRHHRDDELLLSTYVHEQLHWYLEANPKKVEQAVAELKKAYPKVPVGFPSGARNKRSTYEHLIVCYLEIMALRSLIGQLGAFNVATFWAQDHYTWIYQRVLKDEGTIGEIVKRSKLR